MEYIEMPAAAPKGMLGKMISNEGLQVPFGANGTGAAAGFRAMPVPVFSHGKPLASVGMAPVAAVASGIPLNGTLVMPVKGGNGGTGLEHVHMPGESLSPQRGEEAIEKGKRSRAGGDGGRGTRGSGTINRKRTRAVQADTTPLTASEAILDVSLGGGAAPAPAPPAGKAAAATNGVGQLPNSNGDKGEKCASRRQSGQGAKRGDKKPPQAAVTAATDAAPSKGNPEVNGVPNGWSNGILGIYGLRTRPVDVSRFMVDIPLSDLLAGKFEAPKFSLKENTEPAQAMESEDDFAQQIDTVLRLLPTRPVAAEPKAAKAGEVAANSAGGPKACSAKNPRMFLDLERPVPMDEEVMDGVSRPENDLAASTTASFEGNGGSDAGAVFSADLANGGSAAATLSHQQRPPRSLIDSLPSYSVESFLGRLKLPPSNHVQSLLAQAGADGEMSGAAPDYHVGPGVVDACRRSGSVPPLSCSHPHVGPVKPDNGRYIPRIWIRSPAAQGGGFGGKEAEEDPSNSPPSRRQKLDGIIAPTNSGAQAVSPHQSGAYKPAGEVDDPTSSITHEARPTENAEVNAEGNATLMEIDPGSVGVGSLLAGAADGANGGQVNVDYNRQSGGGEAVRPLETLTMPGQNEKGTPLDQPSGKMKQENLDQLVIKDKGVEEAGPSPAAAKLESSSGRPAVELQINVRSSSPPQNDDSSLPACPLSPSVEAAARILMMMSTSTSTSRPAPQLQDQGKKTGEKERRRRGFQPYPDAPVQKTKSVRVNNSAAVPAAAADAGREGRRGSVDGGSVVPGKAPVSERRKSLSQVNDASDKPPFSSPRNAAGGGIPTGSRANHTGARSSSLSVKLEKARESMKDSTSMKELIGGRNSFSHAAPHSGPPLKNGQKGLKSNSYLHPSNSSKSGVAAANFLKAPAACTVQRVVAGGTSARSSRNVHSGNNSLASHGLPTVPLKSSRQSIPESRQKTKSELSGRGVKSGRE